jgi:hypothetical protein
MSSRSLAAARSRRAGENAPPVSGNRPITSIGSHAQQIPSGGGYNNTQPPNNVRVSKSIQLNQNIQSQQFSKQPPSKYNQFYDKNKMSQQPNGLPFSKLSISDAIGLVTLRLGKVEQWVIESEHENQNKEHFTNNTSNIPDNHTIIDNSVLTTIINRLDSLEKNKINNNTETSLEEITKLSEEFKSLNEQSKRIIENVSKHTIEISKNTEQVFRFNRELTETKDILKTFMLKYDQFTEDTTNNFQDYENALSVLEQKIVNENNNQFTEDETEKIENQHESDNLDTSIMSVDLKNIIKQELANI